MKRFVVAVCLLVHSSYGLPQRGVQLGGGPRPVTYATQADQVGPAYTQSLSFGPADAGIRTGAPLSYRSPQPVVLQQRSPSPTPQSSFPSFPSPTAFPSIGSASPAPGRGPLPLRSPVSAAAEDEYDYEDEEEAPKAPVRVVASVPQRAPVRISQSQPAFGQAPQRLVVPQSQPQAQAPSRQRQPVPQRQVPVQSIQQQYTTQPSPQRVAPAPQVSRGQQTPQFGIDGKRTRVSTPPPVQTVNRYMRQNEDGSITWGYENEDGTFKEETIGADCVVRGKYGYVDPDGQKREYEYQSGNPCDPNKKDQEEEEEEERDGPGPRQQIQGVINAPRPRPAQQQRQQGSRPIALQPQYQPQYAQA